MWKILRHFGAKREKKAPEGIKKYGIVRLTFRTGNQPKWLKQ